MAEVTLVHPLTSPRQTVGDLVPEGRPAPTRLAALEVPLQLVPPGEGVLTQRAQELQPAGRHPLQVLLSLVAPQLGESAEHLTAVSTLVAASSVYPLDVSGQGGLREPLVPAQVQLLPVPAVDLAGPQTLTSAPVVECARGAVLQARLQ